MSQLAEDQKFRARESVPGDYVQTLLNSLTLEQIRDAAYLLAPAERISIKSHAGSRQAMAQTHKSNEAICIQLLRVEAQQPLKHCLFFKCTATPSFDALRGQVNSIHSAFGLDFRVAAAFETATAFIITIEHSVEVKEWVRQEDEDLKRLVTIETRHPIVLRVLKKTQIGSLNYPGFSQGQGTKRDKVLQYDDVLRALLKVVADWGFAPKILSVKESLRVLLSGGNSRVHRFRADVEAAGVGRFDLASSRKDVTVEESLAALLRLDLDDNTRARFVESTRKALNEADTNSVLLFWQAEKIVTRLRFWDIGCEIFFVWSGERQTYDIVDPIVEVLAGTHERIGTWIGNQAIPLQWIASLPQGAVKQPAHLAEALNLPPGQARSEFVYAVKAGLVQPLYRLKTNEIIPDFENAWTPRLSDLRRVFRTDGNKLLDGSDPSAIEVAFQRVGDDAEAGN